MFVGVCEYLCVVFVLVVLVGECVDCYCCVFVVDVWYIGGVVDGCGDVEGVVSGYGDNFRCFYVCGYVVVFFRVYCGG